MAKKKRRLTMRTRLTLALMIIAKLSGVLLNFMIVVLVITCIYTIFRLEGEMKLVYYASLQQAEKFDFAEEQERIIEPINKYLSEPLQNYIHEIEILELGWELEETQEPESPEIISIKEYTVIMHQRDILEVSKNEIQLAEAIVAGEALGEGYIGELAVAAVIVNRVYKEGCFGSSLWEVMTEKKAFSVYNKETGEVITNNQPRQTTKEAVQDALNGLDPTNGRLFFCQKGTNINTTENPLEIGDHWFFYEYFRRGY